MFILDRLLLLFSFFKRFRLSNTLFNTDKITTGKISDFLKLAIVLFTGLQRALEVVVEKHCQP